MRKLVSILMLPLIFAACAFNESDTESDPNRRRQAEESNKLIAEYSALQGQYEGEYRRTNGAIEQVDMIFSYRKTQAGTNRDGSPILRPVMIVKLDRPDSTQEDIRFIGSFIRETGEMVLTTRGITEDNICDGECLSLDGNWNNGNFTGEVRSITSGLVQGRINIHRVSTQVDGPSNGDLLDEYEEFRERLVKFVGKYQGFAKSNARGEKDMEIEMILDIVDGPRTERPKLVSTSYRTDGFSRAASHNIRFINDRGYNELIFEPGAGAIGFDAFTMTATWENGVIKGDLRLPKNPTRRFEAKIVK